VWLIALVGIVIPFFSALLIVPLLDQILEDKAAMSESFSWLYVSFLGTSLSVTALPVLACILTEKGLLESELGVLTLGAGTNPSIHLPLIFNIAALEEIFLWFLLTVILSLVHAESLLSSFLMIGSILLFGSVLLFAVRPLIACCVGLVEQSPQGWKWKNSLFAAALVLLMICAWVTEVIGVHPILGAFICGVIIPVRPPNLVSGSLHSSLSLSFI
jgi:Kef-type K+ transport system membrane component KefB